MNIINENDEKSEKLDYNKFLNSNSLHISILYSHFNYFFLWKNVKELEQYKIVLSDCSIQNLQKEYKYVKKENLMIDLPSLITCAYLDILPIIAACTLAAAAAACVPACPPVSVVPGGPPVWSLSLWTTPLAL